MNSSLSYTEHPELAIVALISMLARYPHARCEHMSDSILAHLRYVASDDRFAPAIREAAARIHHEFQFLGADGMADAGAGFPVH